MRVREHEDSRHSTNHHGIPSRQICCQGWDLTFGDLRVEVLCQHSREIELSRGGKGFTPRRDWVFRVLPLTIRLAVHPLNLSHIASPPPPLSLIFSDVVILDEY